MTLVLAHVGGVPVEELLPFAPALLVGATVGARSVVEKALRAGRRYGQVVKPQDRSVGRAGPASPSIHRSLMSTTYSEPAVGAQAAELTLADWPIPADDVISGAPAARGAVISRSQDSRIVRGVWACTPGSFSWRYDCDETVTVLEGRATVVFDNGEIVELAPGSVAFFGRGHDSTWTVHEPVLKGFHLDSPDPLDL